MAHDYADLETACFCFEFEFHPILVYGLGFCFLSKLSVVSMCCFHLPCLLDMGL